MKRILAMLLCVALTLTMFIVPGAVAMADETPVYTDYVPTGTMPGNLINSQTESVPTMLQYFTKGQNGSDVKIGWNSWTQIVVTSTEAYDGTTLMGKTNNYYVPGAEIHDKILDPKSIVEGNNYVVRFWAKASKGSDDKVRDTKVNIGVTNFKYWNNIDYTVEYGEEGMLVGSDKWYEFRGSIPITAPASGQAGNRTPLIHIGLSTKALQGTGVTISDGLNGEPGKVFIAPEIAYDISNKLTEGDSKIERGDTLTFEAQVINQLELPGCLDQTFVWKAMDTSRQKEVEGFTIVPSQDTATAEVTVEDTVLPGSYDIVAYSETYNMAKGFTITMDAPDYYKDSGDITIEAKLNTDSDDAWTASNVTTGLVNSIDVKAALQDNTEAFQWFVTDKDRITVIEDIFTVDVLTKEGAEQTARIVPRTDVDVKPGDYNVIVKAKDGSVKAQPITLNIDGDMKVILETFISGNADNIEAGLNGAYLSVLGLLDSNASKADKKALAAVIADSAEEEGITTSTELSDLQAIVETFAIASYYNTKPADVEVADEDGNFLFAKELGIEDSGETTLYTVFNERITKEGKKALQTQLSAKGYTSFATLKSDAKEGLLLYTLAYPNVNGVEYVSEIFTEANLKAVGIDSSNYLALTEPMAFNDKVAGELYTFAELKEMLEEAQDEVPEDEEEEEDTPTVSKGGGFSVGSSKKEEKEEEAVSPETYSFADVGQSHWAYSDIHYLKSIGVIDGIGDNVFAPEADVTREQFLKIIIDAFNIEKKAAANAFTDVDTSAWYAPYVAAGVANGIITGTSETTFGTGIAITRQDACTILSRALGLVDDAEGDLTFSDADTIASYAKSAVSALAGYAIVNGFEDGTFGPSKLCSRAQAARIVANAIGIVNALNAQ